MALLVQAGSWISFHNLHQFAHIVKAQMNVGSTRLWYEEALTIDTRARQSLVGGRIS